jgi:hypothetical protein
MIINPADPSRFNVLIALSKELESLFGAATCRKALNAGAQQYGDLHP